MQVLVLEQSPMMRRFIREELEWGKYTIVEAETPEEARRILLSEPDIALLTLGTALDGMDGFDFLEEIQAPAFQAELARVNREGIQAVFVTSNDHDRDRLRGYHIGAADFIEKPWTKGSLLAHVDSVLGCSAEMKGMSVLVVDDSRTCRRFVDSCLRRLGVAVHEADDGDTALAFLRDNPVDLVLTDLHMVRMNGDALCLKIRRELKLKDLPVIFLSANEDRAAILTLFKIGATDYLNKPFLKEELMARLRVHLDRAMLARTLHEFTAPDIAATWAAEAEPPAGRDTWRILLVDDSPVGREVGSRLLRKMGCEVDTLTNGQAAVDLFKEGRGNSYDVVLMDLMMPGMDGLEATSQIRTWERALAANDPAYGPPIPIVALTATTEDNQLAACLAAGMNDFLSKPFRLERVRAALRHCGKVAQTA